MKKVSSIILLFFMFLSCEEVRLDIKSNVIINRNCEVEKDYNYLISDFEFTNQFFTLDEMIHFCKMFPKNKLTRKQIIFIYYQCKENKVNPFTVVFPKMQCESGLIKNLQDDYRYEWRENRCMAYGMYVKVNGVPVYKGFSNQISNAIKGISDRFKSYNPLAKIKIKDMNKEIQFDNAATFALYCYTPFWGEHDIYNWKVPISGNKLYLQVYNNYKQNYIQLIERRKHR